MGNAHPYQFRKAIAPARGAGILFRIRWERPAGVAMGVEMAKQQKYPEIIERIEYVRQYLGMNKKEFCGRFGMQPQTYLNYIGPQGSDPSVELLLGVINEYHVNPTWLLLGTGEIFVKPPPGWATLTSLQGGGR